MLCLHTITTNKRTVFEIISLISIDAIETKLKDFTRLFILPEGCPHNRPSELTRHTLLAY